MTPIPSLPKNLARWSALLACPLWLAAATPDKLTVDANVTTEPKNAGVSIWTQNVTAFRQEHGVEGGYTKKWDLGEMPHYQPKRQLTGTLRIWGNNYIKDGYLA